MNVPFVLSLIVATIASIAVSHQVFMKRSPIRGLTLFQELLRMFASGICTGYAILVAAMYLFPEDMPGFGSPFFCALTGVVIAVAGWAIFISWQVYRGDR